MTCDNPEFQTILQPSRTHYEARAVWLNRRLAKWPRRDGSGTFKLYHSRDGTIRAEAGAKVSGAKGAITLEPIKAELPATLATRFKYVGSGVVLGVRDGDVTRLPALHRQQLILVQEADDGSVRAATRLQVAGALDDLYAGAARVGDLGLSVGKKRTTFKLWAPTAQQVSVCLYDTGKSPATACIPMRVDAAVGHHVQLIGEGWNFGEVADDARFVQAS